ncbi:hypothetical protein O1611_g2806 [Lasiodiplodia mahajangana]|uniref:Uncharacterized protein n=1 Tax=Lasiodiplodia mahajangana TaxID=1108764 RepID=A0ACC2JUG0_9PEZI|nr:hypothetical protein O1611_g2806 [Lasiodiplodia mahajangana]
MTTTSEKSLNLFPHLPPYSDPKDGIVSKLPAGWIPYAQLMRIDQPAGLYAFYFPYLIGLMYTACINHDTVDPLLLLKLAGVLLPINILLRGLSCSWNDTMDQDFDRKVRRCRHRPIARGAVSTTQAHIFTFSQLGILLLILHKFPESCQLHMIAIVLLFGAYALMKRITYFPQVFLGFPFAWAVFFCVTLLDEEAFGANTVSHFALFFANVLWTITYDTIYAHQDVVDDKQAGVKSMALLFRDHTKILATVMSAFQVALLGLCGLQAGFGPIYHVGTVGGASLALAYYIYSVDLKSPDSCNFWFHAQFWSVGGASVSGFVGEYVTRRAG